MSTYNLEPGLYTSITDIVEAMNTFIQERNNHNESCITVKVSRRSQKVVIILANDTSGLAFCSTDLEVAISEISYHSMYQNTTDWNFKFF